jgi:hypothetical protein
MVLLTDDQVGIAVPVHVARAVGEEDALIRS